MKFKVLLVIFEAAFKLQYKCECVQVRAGARRPAAPLLNVLDRRKQEKSHWLAYPCPELLLRGQPCPGCCADTEQTRQRLCPPERTIW